MTTTTRFLLAATALALGCAGPDTSFRNLVPVMEVNPGLVDFADVGPPLSADEIVFIDNTGLATLEVSAEIRGGRDTYRIVELDFEVPSNETHELVVTFSPETFLEYNATLVLTSNDEEHPEEEVILKGRGVDLPLPDIAIEPSQTIEVVDVPIGDDELMFFEIANVGDAPLVIEEVVFDGPPVFTVQVQPTPNTTIEPNARMPMIVEYAPTGDQGDSATVTLVTNDPDEGTTAVLLLGNGGGEFEYPEAVIDCPTTDVELLGPEWVHFDGSSSFDPAGYEPLDFRWLVLARPPGADPGNWFDPDDQPSADLFVDAAGTWTVGLQVINSLGTTSVPAVCTFGAVPADDLHVELSWDTSLADLDLHLLQGGATWFETPGDCNYCNKSPNWGTASSDDDPRLDLDDLGGFGPENINILAPEDGTYDVKVHYFEDNMDGPVVATVKVYTYGAEVWSDSQVMTRNQVWDVGSVDMPSGTFFPDPPATLWNAGTQRTCF